MRKTVKHLGESERDHREGGILLSILFEAAAYASPVSTDVNSRSISRRREALATGNIEIGDGVNIKVNGLRNWPAKAE